MIQAAIFFSLPAAALGGGQAAQAQTDAAASRFETMKALVGSWRLADKPASPLRIHFSLTAGGSVLLEQWSRGEQPHSLTVYHRDGAALIATHYCSQGNQPRLTLAPEGSAQDLRFAFRDATDLDTNRESYLVALRFHLSPRGVLVRSETYRQRGADETSELRLMRAE